MRTLFEIIESVKDGERPYYEELRYALVALDNLAWFDRKDMTKLAVAENVPAVWGLKGNESFKRWKRAMGKDPKKWLGPGYDPDTAECQAMRKTAFAIGRAAGVLPKEESNG